jgi:hypothetical protein
VIDHHPTLESLRDEHGFAPDWTDEQVAARYGSYETLHDRDHADPEFRHASELVELLGEV